MLINPGITQCVNCKCYYIPKSHNSKFCSVGCRKNPIRNCIQCGIKLISSIVLDKKRYILSSRKKCLTCSPMKKICQKTKDQVKIQNVNKQRKYHSTHRDILNARVKKCRVDGKAKILALTNGCQFCGYNKIQRNLAFHHINEELKSFNVSGRSFQWKLERLLPELEKCIVSCHNCHGEIHDNLISVEAVKKANIFFREQLLRLAK